MDVYLFPLQSCKSKKRPTVFSEQNVCLSLGPHHAAYGMTLYLSLVSGNFLLSPFMTGAYLNSLTLI